MKQTKKHLGELMRVANQIEKQYLNYRRSPPVVVLDIEIMERLHSFESRLELVESKGWQIAKDRLKRDYQSQLVKLRENIDRNISQRAEFPSFVLTATDIFRDLLAIESEFGVTSCCNRAKYLSVVTDPIEMEGTYLGAFKIRLDFGSLQREANGHYEIIPIDPYPAASNEDVTHPHVQGLRLCEGDAQPAIQLALRQGRLLDFFQLVINVLNTYNSSSAYVSLDDWGDLTCSDCGHLANGDDCDNCSVCEERVCDSCWCNCGDCDERHCGGCNHACAACLADVCKSCALVCNQCHESYCSDCLNENERCNHCDKKLDDDTNQLETDDEDTTGTSDADSPVHGDGLGQVAVPT